MAEYIELGYDSVTIAKALRWAGREKGYQLNMTQLNKLLYIAYGTLLVRKRERLTSEHPAAWPYGPVFPRIHTHIKLSDPVTDKEFNTLNEDTKELLRQVVDSFGDISASKLSAWSHEKGSPWDIAQSKNDKKWNQKLDDDDIYAFFYNFIKVEKW